MSLLKDWIIIYIWHYVTYQFFTYGAKPTGPGKKVELWAPEKGVTASVSIRPSTEKNLSPKEAQDLYLIWLIRIQTLSLLWLWFLWIKFARTFFRGLARLLKEGLGLKGSSEPRPRWPSPMRQPPCASPREEASNLPLPEGDEEDAGYRR